MQLKLQDIINRITAILISFLTLFTNTGFVYADENGGSATSATTNNAANTVSDDEVRAFKIGSVFGAVVGVLSLAVAHVPVKEANGAISYYGARRAKYKNFVKSFPECLNDESDNISVRQEGILWDWAACLEYIIKLQKNVELNQKDIVKRLFGQCAFFEHNRKESLPTNEYYSSGLIKSINAFADENDMIFARELLGFGLNPVSENIANSIMSFYTKHGKKPFVISDSYFYNGDPFVHFVVVSEIDVNGIMTVKDPAVGLTRKQPLNVFCQGYVYENGCAKLPSLDMFTLDLKVKQ